MQETICNLYSMLIKDMEKDEISEWNKKAILKLLSETKKNMENSNLVEEIKDIVFQASEIGEETGFVRGFRYAVKLLSECI